MKIKSVILCVLCIAMLVISVGCGESKNTVSQNKNVVSELDPNIRIKFRGEISDIDAENKTMLIIPNEKYNESKMAKKINVSTDVDAENMPEKLEKGKEVEIIYNGYLEAGNPANIATVYSITYVDELAETTVTATDATTKAKAKAESAESE